MVCVFNVHEAQGFKGLLGYGLSTKYKGVELCTPCHPLPLVISTPLKMLFFFFFTIQ
jgi:hypothetical protein